MVDEAKVVPHAVPTNHAKPRKPEKRAKTIKFFSLSAFQGEDRRVKCSSTAPQDCLESHIKAKGLRDVDKANEESQVTGNVGEKQPSTDFRA